MTDLHPIEASALHARRERVFLVLAGLFLGSMTMLNILGVSRFIDLSFELGGVRVPMALAAVRRVARRRAVAATAMRRYADTATACTRAAAGRDGACAGTRADVSVSGLCVNE